MSTDSLRTLATARGLNVGAAFNAHAFADDPLYAPTLAREFNCLVAENIMKGRYLQPERGRFHFADADAMLAFAETHHMKVRGHTLAWHTQQPDWVVNGNLSRADALAALREHVTTVVDHFRGRVFAWDVVNEAVADQGESLLREKSPWFQAIGPDYIDAAFHAARAADPDAQLFYNDYDIAALDTKAERCLTLVQGLLERDVPVHGVGFQHHIKAVDAPGREKLAQRIRRFNDLGLVVHITELDLSLPAHATDADFERQADTYRGVFEAALAAPDCRTITTWGVTDRYSWVPSFTKGECDHALLFDRDYQPKPAYHAVCDALRRA